eukprot:SAG31_NODE_793_length_12044_cov_12.886229_15_plen_47_part_00
MAAPDVFKLRAPPPHFKESFDRDGCFVFESCMAEEVRCLERYFEVS